MTTVRHRRRRDAADLIGWLLGATIVVLAVLDLMMIWSTLWNVPNPISKFFEPQAVSAAPPPPHPAPAPFR